MFEIVEAKSGLPTLKVSGRLLASKVDPRSEAEKWALKIEDQVRGLKSAIIFGLGAGYHLTALKAMHPHLQVIAIEENKNVIEFHEQSLELARFGIKVCPLSEGLFEQKEITRALTASYKIFVHPSAQLTFTSNIMALKDELNGRTPEGLRRLCTLRHLELHKTDSNELLSFRQAKITGPDNFNTVTAILGELIK